MSLIERARLTPKEIGHLYGRHDGYCDAPERCGSCEEVLEKARAFVKDFEAQDGVDPERVKAIKDIYDGMVHVAEKRDDDLDLAYGDFSSNGQVATKVRHRRRRKPVVKPFAGFKDFAACVTDNKDKDDPQAYCAALERETGD